MASKEPLYTLPHGIEVIGEYPASGTNRYWRVRIRPHRFFSSKVIGGGMYVRRSRAVLSAKLGRALSASECAHHKNEDRSDDSPDNLEIRSPAAHNKHHKLGSRHSLEAKLRIAAGVSRAIAEGRRAPPPGRDQTGEKNTQAKLDRTKVAKIRASQEPDSALASIYGVSRRTVGMARKGMTWK